MLTVALTGGIASGKSVVAEVFRARGGFVESADATARELMRPGRPAWKKIKAYFGEDILSPDRTIDRKKLAGIVFRDAMRREALNAMTHPLVIAEQRRTIARLKTSGRVKIYVSEAALTIETGFDVFFDKVVVVHCPRRVQISRLMARDGLRKADAARRVAAQMPAGEKKKRADYVIDAGNGIEETIAQAERVYIRLLEDEARLRRTRSGGLIPGRRRGGES
jgi:dephospho-CoA kinase